MTGAKNFDTPMEYNMKFQSNDREPVSNKTSYE